MKKILFAYLMACAIVGGFFGYKLRQYKNRIEYLQNDNAILQNQIFEFRSELEKFYRTKEMCDTNE